MEQQKHDIKKIIIFCAIILLLILFLIFYFTKINKPQTINYGVLPSDINEYVPENYEYDEETGSYVPVNDVKFVFPEEATYEEFSYTGGGMLPEYTDEYGSEYERKTFPNLGYAMYIPKKFHVVEHTSDYLNNTYYLKPDDNNGLSPHVQIGVTSLVGLGDLTFFEKKKLFEPTLFHYEWNFNGRLYISNLYYSKMFEAINVTAIPGFEDCDPDVVAYIDTPSMTFVDKNAKTNVLHPSVQVYYIFKEDIAVMITVIGSGLDQMEMTLLGTTMALNLREIEEDNCNALHFKDLVQYQYQYATLNIPEEWEYSTSAHFTKYFTPTKDNTKEGYGINVYYEETLNKVDPANFEPNKRIDLYEVILLSQLGNCKNIPYKELSSIDWFIKYNPDDITSQTYNGVSYIRVPYTLCIDNFSYMPDFGLICNELKNIAYYRIFPDGTYTVVDFQYLETHEKYIDTLINNFMSNISCVDYDSVTTSDE